MTRDKRFDQRGQTSIYLCFALVMFSFPLCNQEQDEIDFEQINPATILNLLKDENVLGDLELSNAQNATLKELEDKFKSKLDLEFKKPSGTRNVSGIYLDGVNQIIGEVLLPHQKKRLVQLVYRRALIYRYRGSYPRIMTEMFSNKLELTKLQKEKINLIETESQSELDKEIKAFQSRISEILKKQRENSVATLVAKQKQTLDEALGEKTWGLPEEVVTKQILQFYIDKIGK